MSRSRVPALHRSALYTACALEAMSYGAIYALLVALQHRYHLPTWGLGAIAGATFAAQVVAQLTLAPWADRGHTRTMLRAGVVLAACGVVSFGFSDALWEFVVSRIVLGFGSGLFLPAALRVIISSAGREKGRAVGVLTSVQVAGFALGPPVAAGINALAGLRAPFLAQGMALAACTLMLGRVAEPPFEVYVRRAPMRKLIGIRAVRSGLAVGSGVFLTIGAFEAIWARFLSDRGASTSMIAVGVTLITIPLVVLAPIGGRVVDRFGAARAGVLALAVLPVILLCLALPVGFWFTVFIAVGQVTLIAVCLPASQATIALSSPEDLLASGQALNGALGAAAAALASILAAAIYDTSGSTATWVVISAGTSALAGLARLWQPEQRLTLIPEGAPFSSAED